MLDTILQRGTHLAIALILIYLTKPSKIANKVINLLIDVALIVASSALVIYTYMYLTEIYYRSGRFTTFEVVLGVLFIIALCEGARRLLGWTLTIVSGIALLYCILGYKIPILNLGFRQLSFSRIIYTMTYTTEGIFSSPIASVSSVVIPFLLFAEVLDATGARQLLMDFALMAFGSKRGGAAKVAVVSSGLFGMVSGSAVANVVSTGTITIPLMKKSGFDKGTAGAIEACASTGGMLAPPIMGAAAFVMAEFLGVSYLHILKSAIGPALLYYFAIYMIVEFKTMDKKSTYTVAKEDLNIVQLTKRQLVQKSITVIVPIGTLLILMNKFSVHRAVMIAIFTLAICALLTGSAEGLKHPLQICTRAAKHILPVAMATGLGGVVVGVINSTGLGFKIANLLIVLSGNSLLLLLLMAMVASIIFGMGLPPTACYILIALLVAPVMIERGIIAISAHLFAFYFGILAGVTPPVATSSYTAAAIAEESPTIVGWSGFRILLVLAFVPYGFVYYPSLLLLEGTTFISFSTAFLTTLFTILLGAAAISGYLFWCKLSMPERLIIIIAELLTFSPTVPFLGNIALFGTVMVFYYFKGKRISAKTVIC
jgi:TRAP transporter 4TM/12TM fusion protein